MKKNQKSFCVAGLLLLMFLLWTIAIQNIDVQAIGPRESKVGFAALNGWFHSITGVNWLLYNITDWLGLVPLCFCFGFAILGLTQLIKRRSLLKVDGDILVLGGFYIIVIAAYVAFEVFAINYRPVLINDYLEASYPPSTTLLVMCVMPTVIMQLNKRMKNTLFRKIVDCVIVAFVIFMVVGRLISGVHWITDIIGSLFLSFGLVLIYYSIINTKQD